MTGYPHDDSHQFAKLLLDDGLIRSEDWEIAESIQHVQGGRLLEILLGLCPLSEEDLYQAIARQLRYPFWSEMELLQAPIPDELLLRFPVTIALECDFLPTRWEPEHRRLHIVLSNPLDISTLDAIQMYAQAEELVIAVATPSDVVTAIQIHYKQGQAPSNAFAEEENPLFAEPFDAPRRNPISQTSHGIAPPKIQKRECPACHHMEPMDVAICTRCSSPMDLAEADPLLGKTIKGFTLQTKLGEGGMGLVYGAAHLETGKEAAVKILRSHLSSNERVVRRFHREAQAQNQLRHDNIVHVHDFGFEKGVGFFIAMEFLRGLSMEEILEEENHRITPFFIRSVLSQVCDAMGLAHSRGIFHRDLKPDNIFLLGEDASYHSEEPHVKILDFGVAKMVASEEDERLTRTGMTIGTPRYMAPEQAGDGNTDHRSDIYSLGVILFEMLTGHPPFEGSSAYQIMLRHVYADPPVLSHVRPDLPFPSELEEFLIRVLAKEPKDRPASMDLFWREFHPAMELFEARLPQRQPLHSLEMGRKEVDSSESTEAPVFVGRLAPEDERVPAQATPPREQLVSQPVAVSAPIHQIPEHSHASSVVSGQKGSWLDEGELDLWEDSFPDEPGAARLQQAPPQPLQQAPMPYGTPVSSNVLPDVLYHPPMDELLPEIDTSAPLMSPTTFPNGSGEFALDAEPSGEAPFSVPSRRPLQSTPAPPSRLPKGPMSSRGTGSSRLLSLSEIESQEDLPASGEPAPKSVSLRSGPRRQNQRNRFSNALKKPDENKGKPKYLLMIVIGLLLFGGGLLATLLILMRTN